MRKRITAIVNTTSKNYQAIAALLIESSESFSSEDLPNGEDRPTNNKPPKITPVLRKPVRYRKGMIVAFGKEPKEGLGQLYDAWTSLKKHYGAKAFDKSKAGTILKKDMKGYSGSIMTRLIDGGYLVPTTLAQ